MTEAGAPEVWKGLLERAPPVYDIRIFELLPLQIKISVIENYEVLFGNRLDLSEYFYIFRKMWRDTKHRIEDNRFGSAKEQIEAIDRYRRFISHLQGWGGSYLVEHVDSLVHLCYFMIHAE